MYLFKCGKFTVQMNVDWPADVKIVNTSSASYIEHRIVWKILTVADISLL